MIQPNLANQVWMMVSDMSLNSTPQLLEAFRSQFLATFAVYEFHSLLPLASAAQGNYYSTYTRDFGKTLVIYDSP